MSKPERITTTPRGISEYEDNIVIVLEGQSDYQILAQRLEFEQRESLEFQVAGGHEAVMAKVRDRQESGDHRYYGLVDRDVLHKKGKIEALLEADDKKFEKLKPFGEYIKVLHRWELENYLLAPRFLAESISDNPRVKESETTENVLRLFLQLSEVLKPITVNAIATQELKFLKPITKKKDWMKQLNGKSKAESHQICKKHYLDQVRKKEGLSIDQKVKWLDEITAKVDAFESSGDSPEDRWNKVNRIIDGKKLLSFLKQHFPLRQSIQTKALARKIRVHERLDNAKYLDDYLEGLMDDFENMVEDW